MSRIERHPQRNFHASLICKRTPYSKNTWKKSIQIEYDGFSILFTEAAVWIWCVPYFKMTVICIEDVVLKLYWKERTYGSLAALKGNRYTSESHLNKILDQAYPIS